MKAKVIDHPNQQQPRQPRLEDTPQYKEALVSATNDILGEAIGNLGDARARVALYERSLQQLQQQNQILQQQLAERQEKPDTPSASPEETTKLQRRLDAETRERQALEGQLRELRKKAQDVESLQKEIETQRRIDEKSEARIQALQKELTQARQAAANQNHDNERLRARVKDLEGDRGALLKLVADIRAAAGDPEGKLMQEDLVTHIAALHANQKKPRKKAAPKKK